MQHPYQRLAGFSRLIATTVITFIAMAVPSSAEALRDKVVGVTDGDTIRLLVDGHHRRKGLTVGGLTQG